MRSACIQAVSKAVVRQITHAEVANIESRIRKTWRYLWQADQQTLSELRRDGACNPVTPVLKVIEVFKRFSRGCKSRPALDG